MKIQFLDLNSEHKKISKQIKHAIDRVIKRSDFVLGEDVKLFEAEFAKFCHVQYAVGVSSGTAALFLALESLGIKPGDEVIVPDFTYIATALAVSYTGARPVFVDIDEKTYNIDVNKIEQAITKNTKAIIPVHLYGQPADMAAILKIAKKYNLKVIEDAAQAHGSSVNIDGQWCAIGGIGDIGCFSFYPTKNLGALGDGGIITTNSGEVYKKMLMLRDYGRVSRYEHSMVGYNSRLDTLQAAILQIKLKRLNLYNQSRNKVANIYNRLLKDVEDVIIPWIAPFVKSVYHVYALRIKNRQVALDAFKKAGISVLIHYPIPLHLQIAYQNLGYRKGDFPVSEKICNEIVSLPIYPGFKKAQIEFIVKTLKGAI